MNSELKLLQELLKNKMESTIHSFNKTLNVLRTGKASASILDLIKINAYGSDIPLNQISNITTPDPKTLLIQIWDKELVLKAEKSIMDSGLSLRPNTEGQFIRLNIPSISEERRKDLVKKASEYSEQAKVSIRNIRRSNIDDLKQQEKDKLISEDELKLYSQKIQKTTNEFVQKIEIIFNSKSKEIMKI